jgi:hypothetical protein
MRVKIIVLTLILSPTFFSCSSNKDRNRGELNQLKSIEIQLYPAFNNSSVILIDKGSRIIRFKVDTTLKYVGDIPTEYESNLDSFEKNTLIDSFYSSSFLDSITLKPARLVVVTDGLSIYTVMNRKNRSDTIESGNFYPKLLSNILFLN